MARSMIFISLLLSHLHVALSLLNITGLWTADNFGDLFIDGRPYTPKDPSWDDWRVPKQIGPIIIDQDEAIIQFTVRNVLHHGLNNPAALFACIFVNDELYTKTGDDGWRSTRANDTRLDQPGSWYDAETKVCGEVEKLGWLLYVPQFWDLLTYKGCTPLPVWPSETCIVGVESRVFVVAVSSKYKASEAHKKWLDGTLFESETSAEISSYYDQMVTDQSTNVTPTASSTFDSFSKTILPHSPTSDSNDQKESNQITKETVFSGNVMIIILVLVSIASVLIASLLIYAVKYRRLKQTRTEKELTHYTSTSLFFNTATMSTDFSSVYKVKPTRESATWVNTHSDIFGMTK